MSQSHHLEQLKWLTHFGPDLLADETALNRPSGLVGWQKALLDEQVQLRRRARRRFPDADAWIWSDRSLSQASDFWSARFKAALIPSDVRAFDLCCGAGVDLVAVAEHTQAVGVDNDPLVLMLARANLQSHGRVAELRETTLDAAHLRPLQVDSHTWLHVDPDRRASGSKTNQADAFCPPLDVMLPATRRAAGAIIKVAPKTHFSHAAPMTQGPSLGSALASEIARECHRVWVGNLGECRQQLLLFGDARQRFCREFFAIDSGRSSVLVEPLQLDQPEYLVHCFTGTSGVSSRPSLPIQSRCPEPEQFVYDLHTTLHASNLQFSWATIHGLEPISAPHGFFVSSQKIQTPWAQCFQVLEVSAWDDRKLRKLLNRRKSGMLEVKNRLIKLDANYFQRRYSRAEGEPLSLLITRLGDRIRCIVAKRVEPDDS